MKKRVLVLILALVMALSLLPGAAIAASDLPLPKEISMPAQATVYQEDSYTIEPQYKPENADVFLDVVSSNPKIAEGHAAGHGDSWNLVGISPGECDIVVTTQNGLKAKTHVTVLPSVLPKSISYNEPITIQEDENRYIDPIVSPGDARTMFSIQSDNPAVVSVFGGGAGRSIVTKNGYESFYSSVGVTGVSPGTANITVRTTNGCQTTVAVTVQESVKPRRITIPKTYTISEGGEWDPTIIVEPEDAIVKFSIDSEDSTVARVTTTGAYSGCRVYGVEAGTTNIRITTQNGVSASCKVTVQHVWGDDYTIEKKPTCLPGKKVLHCTVCGAAGKAVAIPAVREHTLVDDAEVVPTCTEAGRTAGVHCSDCGTVISGNKTIPATGHKWGEWKITTEPTCTEKGVQERVCANDKSHVETKGVAALGHKLTKTEAVAATSDKDGNIEYYTCDVCGKLFSDAKAKKETTAEDTVIPALGEEPCDGGKNCPSIKLADVDRSAKSWYHEAVDWAYVEGVVKGTSDTTFAPADTCTRGQVVTFLWRAAGEPAPKSTKNPFKDVSKDAYYYKAVLWAVENEITNGTSKTTFSPNDPCTRAHVVTFLWRSEGTPAVTSKNPFKDVKAGQYYTDAVLWAVKNEITNGKSATSFAPSDPCTRAQIVAFLYRDMK